MRAANVWSLREVGLLIETARRNALGNALLGLDVGTKHVGVAVSDATLTFAVPLVTLHRRRSRPRYASANVGDPFWRELGALVHEHDVCACVVGWPLTKSGSPSSMCAEVLRFIEEMDREAGLPPVTLFDERYSTRSAVQPMHDAGVSKRRMAKLKDQTAAVVILQDALDTLSVSDM